MQVPVDKVGDAFQIEPHSLSADYSPSHFFIRRFFVAKYSSIFQIAKAALHLFTNI
jgi:hypothetical protein